MTKNMEINRLSLVRQRANSLRKKYGLSIPINLDTIINKKGIEILNEENQVGIDGLCQLQKTPPRIIINTEVTFEPRLRFTIAHEIGHICIPWHTGVDLCSLDDPYIKIQGQRLINTQELEANIFASELLMPTEWLKQNFKLNSETLQCLVKKISRTAHTSYMACFYALENVLPPGHLFFVKNDAGEYWKSFRSIGTNSSFIFSTDAIPFFDRTSYWKETFRISYYQVVHYKIIATPDLSTINAIYTECHSNIEELLIAITGGKPIEAIPYIDKIINVLNDKYYVIIQIGNILRHFRHSEAAIRIHSQTHCNIKALYDHVKENFLDYGRISFSTDSCMLWIKEHWRGNHNSNFSTDPNELLKIIVGELYEPEEAHHMLQSINGVIASINSSHKTASEDQLYHFARIRYETDPKYKEFSEHHLFEQYLSEKISMLVSHRSAR